MTGDSEAQQAIAYPRGIVREVTPLSLWGGDTLIYRTIVALAAIALPVVAAVHWAMRGELPWPQLIFTASMLGGSLTCLEVARRGQREIAAALLIGLLWLGTTIYAFKTGYGMHSALVFIYLPCMLYTALFFGIAIASSELVLTVATLSVMYVAEANGRLDGAAGVVATGTGFNYLLGIVVTLVATLAAGLTYHRRVEREAARVVAEAARHYAEMQTARTAQTQIETANARLQLLHNDQEARTALRDAEIARLKRDLDLLRSGLAGDASAAAGTLAGLASSSLRPLQREALDVSALAHKAVAEARRHAEHARISIKISTRLRASADRRMVEALLGLLVERACRSCRGEPDPGIDIGGGSLEGQPVFFVRDNGPVLDAAQRARLFEPFAHGAATHDLSVVHARCVAERHGGELVVESVQDEGTTVHFSLPG